jgi:hypothetical protein
MTNLLNSSFIKRIHNLLFKKVTENINLVFPFDEDDLTRIFNLLSNAIEISIRKSGINLKYVPSNMITQEICEQAVEQNPLALQYVSPQLQLENMCLKAIEQNPLVLQYVSPRLQSENMCLKAVEKNPNAFKFIVINVELNKFIYNELAKSSNLENFLREKSGTDIFVTNCIEYYSSFIVKSGENPRGNFDNDRFIWLSDNFDQAFLHLFNGT